MMRYLQMCVDHWLRDCLGDEIAEDPVERNERFLEEALELVQACGCDRESAHKMVDYVFDRPVGEKAQEVGGVMVCLAALCTKYGLALGECFREEVRRVWHKKEQIRAKHAGKPRMKTEPET